MKTLKNILTALATVATVAATIYAISVIMAYIIVIGVALFIILKNRIKRFIIKKMVLTKREAIENGGVRGFLTTSIVGLLEEVLDA